VFTPLNNLEIDIIAFPSSLLFNGVHPVKYESIFNGVHLWFLHILGLLVPFMFEPNLLNTHQTEGVSFLPEYSPGRHSPGKVSWCCNNYKSKNFPLTGVERISIFNLVLAVADLAESISKGVYYA